jgi:hypothetical protein
MDYWDQKQSYKFFHQERTVEIIRMNEHYWDEEYIKRQKWNQE